MISSFSKKLRIQENKTTFKSLDMSKPIFKSELIVIVLGLFIFFSSCSKTSLVYNWENEELRSQTPFESFAIVAVMGENMSSNIFEQGIINIFRKKGIEIKRGSHHLDADKKYTREQIQDTLKNQSVEAVMFFKLLGMVKEKSYVPPTTYYYPYSPYFGYGYPYYSPYGPYQATPGYWTVDDNFEIEIAIYTTKGDKLVYTARTDTLNPKSSMELAESVAKKIYRNLIKHKIIERDRD